MPFDRATFYDSLRHGTLFDKGLSTRQVQGTEAILNAWDKSGETDDRWLAYMLATTYHETGRAMFPVPEGGKGKGHPYGKAAANGQVYYGRGDVQLTWQANYEKADAALGLGGRLVADADLALDPDIAAQILIRGMSAAWFTAFKLSDYLNDHLADYLHARRIVNGMDHAETIAGYALVFYAAIQAGAHKAADHTAVAAPAKPVVVPAPPDPLTAAVSDVASSIIAAVDTIGDPPAPDAPADPAPPPPKPVTAPPAPPPAAPASPPSAGPSPGATAPASATTESQLMELLPLLIQLFGGVAGKIGVASSVATALPTVVEGTMANLSEAPKAITEIEKLIADVKAGNWTNTPADVHTLLAEFAVILKNYGVDLPAMTAMVAQLPAMPAVTSAPVAPAAAKTA